MSVAYRRARAEEIERAEELVVRSINDLTERHGFGPMATLRPPQFQLFSWNDDPDGLWVAEDAGQMLGFAFSWVCGKLLKRTLQHAQKMGAARKALITFTFNTVSQGLYIRHGYHGFRFTFLRWSARSLEVDCKTPSCGACRFRTQLRTCRVLCKLMLKHWGYRARSIIGS